MLTPGKGNLTFHFHDDNKNNVTQNGSLPYCMGKLKWKKTSDMSAAPALKIRTRAEHSPDGEETHR